MINFWCDWKLTTSSILLALMSVSLCGANAEANSTLSEGQLLLATSSGEIQEEKSSNLNLLPQKLKSVISTETELLSPQNSSHLIASSFSGRASWYGPGFHGRLTANGERYNQNAMTAAHRSLRFGTKVRVTNLNNGRSVIVRINDRGPFIKGRVIDLSAAAAQSLNMIHSGVAPVQVTILNQ